MQGQAGGGERAGGSGGGADCGFGRIERQPAYA